MFWVWTVSLPVTLLNSPNVTKFNQPEFGTGCDIAGVILWGIGFIMESVSDIQKYRFRTANGSDGTVCDVGFFAWTRHPNYFGEIIIQFGGSWRCICSWRKLTVPRYLHHCCVASGVQLRLGRCLRCPLCVDPRAFLLDPASHVRIRSYATGTPSSKEEV